MKPRDGRGDHSKKVAQKNRIIIKEFFDKNKEATMIECTRATGFAFRTIERHLAAIHADENNK